MNWKSPEEESRFDEAVARCFNQTLVSVGPDRIARFLNETQGLEMTDANRLRCLAIKLENEEFEHG